MKVLKSKKEKLQKSIDEQKTRLSSIRNEKKEMQTAIANIDAILEKRQAPEKGKRRPEPER